VRLEHLKPFTPSRVLEQQIDGQDVVVEPELDGPVGGVRARPPGLERLHRIQHHPAPGAPGPARAMVLADRARRRVARGPGLAECAIVAYPACGCLEDGGEVHGSEGRGGEGLRRDDPHLENLEEELGIGGFEKENGRERINLVSAMPRPDPRVGPSTCCAVARNDLSSDENYHISGGLIWRGYDLG